MGDTNYDEFGQIEGSDEPTTYRVSLFVYLARLIAWVVGVIAALNASLTLIWIPLTLMMAVIAVFSLLTGLPDDGEWGWFLVWMAIGTVNLLSSAFASLIAWIMLRFALSTPTTITLTDDGLIAFRTWWRTIKLHPAEIHSVATGAWYGPRRCSVRVRYQGGAIAFLNLFHDFPDFLDRLKALNPAVEIEGF